MGSTTRINTYIGVNENKDQEELGGLQVPTAFRLDHADRRERTRTGLENHRLNGYTGWTCVSASWTQLGWCFPYLISRKMVDKHHTDLVLTHPLDQTSKEQPLAPWDKCASVEKNSTGSVVHE